MSTTRIPKKAKNLTSPEPSIIYPDKKPNSLLYAMLAIALLGSMTLSFYIGYRTGKEDGVTDTLHFMSKKITTYLDQSCFDKLMKAMKEDK